MKSVKFFKILYRTIIALFIIASLYAILTGATHHFLTLGISLICLAFSENNNKRVLNNQSV